MGILQKIKKKVYNSKLIKRQFEKYCYSHKKETIFDTNSIIEIKDDKFYTLNSPAGKIYFNIDDANLEEDTISNLIKSCNDIILHEALSIVKFVGYGGTILDMGANLGVFSFSFAKKGAKVYGFEGNALNYKQLVKTAEFNKFDCEFYNVAIVDKSGEYQFQSYGPWGSLTYASENLHWLEEKINTIKGISIDDWYLENKIVDEIKLIKLDIEGAELMALEGMHNFLQEKSYPPFFVESNIACLAFLGENTTKNFIGKFKELGYTPYFIKDAETVELFENNYQLNVVEDFLMVHKNNTKILENKTILECRKYTDSEFYEYAMKLDLIEETVYPYAIAVKNSTELLASPLLADFIKFHKKFNNPYNKKINSELEKLTKKEVGIN